MENKRNNERRQEKQVGEPRTASGRQRKKETEKKMKKRRERMSINVRKRKGEEKEIEEGALIISARGKVKTDEG